MYWKRRYDEGREIAHPHYCCLGMRRVGLIRDRGEAVNFSGHRVRNKFTPLGAMVQETLGW